MDKSNKASFRNDLAAKIGAGRPSKPVGLLKKSRVAEIAEEQARHAEKSRVAEDSEEQAKHKLQQTLAAKKMLADILQKSTDNTEASSTNDKPSS